MASAERKFIDEWIEKHGQICYASYCASCRATYTCSKDIDKYINCVNRLMSPWWKIEDGK